jgi:uncharacterized protein (TIGR02453 family)
MAHFSPRLFAFLRDLAAHNDREWFAAHRDDYERHVRLPALRFIADLVEPFAAISPHFIVEPSVVGGSLIRMARDIRFSVDKSPYRTYLGVGIRHRMHEEAATPRFYLAIQPGRSYLGVGCWRPDAATAAKIRRAIADRPDEWEKTVGAPDFEQRFTLEGERLARPPRGFDADPPLIDDLRRKAFAASARFTNKAVTSSDFIDVFLERCRVAAPFVSFLCSALDVPFD